MAKKKANTPAARRSDTNSVIFNPFENRDGSPRDAQEVWAEIRKNTTATTREEALEAMQLLRRKKINGKPSQKGAR